MICSCNAAGHCPVFNRHLAPREFDICRGEVLTEEKCEWYRQHWLNGPQIPTLMIDFGPGTELETIIKASGIEPKAKEGCQSCSALRDQMNMWGVQGCKDHRDSIIKEIQARSKEYSWTEKARAAVAAVNMDFTINLFDPFGSIVDQAIKRAEANETRNIA